MKKQIKQHQKRERKLQKQRLKELRGRRLGLYLHIPFCKQKCDYCDFYSLAGNQDRMEGYLKALTLHLEEVAPRAEGFTVDSQCIRRGAAEAAAEDGGQVLPFGTALRDHCGGQSGQRDAPAAEGAPQGQGQPDLHGGPVLPR